MSLGLRTRLQLRRITSAQVLTPPSCASFAGGFGRPHSSTQHIAVPNGSGRGNQKGRS